MCNCMGVVKPVFMRLGQLQDTLIRFLLAQLSEHQRAEVSGCKFYCGKIQTATRGYLILVMAKNIATLIVAKVRLRTTL